MIVGKESVSVVGHRYNNNLTVLTSGKIPPNPAEMLGSKSMKALIEALKKVNANIIGTILNGVDTKKNDYYYYYGDK